MLYNWNLYWWRTHFVIFFWQIIIKVIDLFRKFGLAQHPDKLLSPGRVKYSRFLNESYKDIASFFHWIQSGPLYSKAGGVFSRHNQGNFNTKTVNLVKCNDRNATFLNRFELYEWVQQSLQTLLFNAKDPYVSTKSLHNKRNTFFR